MALEGIEQYNLELKRPDPNVEREPTYFPNVWQAEEILLNIFD